MTNWKITSLKYFAIYSLILISLSIPIFSEVPYWPTKEWKVRKISLTTVQKKSLQAFESYSFPKDRNDETRAGVRTDGIVIIRDGYLIYEKYSKQYNKDKPHLAWSATKSFVNALYGIVVKEGLVNIDDPLAKHNKAFAKGEHKKITINHVLQFSSGIVWNEGYESSSLKSDVIAMLYTRGRKDMSTFVAQSEVGFPPGTRWKYSSGDTNILMGTLKGVVGEQNYPNYPWEKLFDPLGMKNVTWERDQSGTFVGSSYIYATPRDLAKFGYLYLQDGVWENKRIFPKGWVKYTTTVPPAFYKAVQEGRYKEEPSGAHWWLNAGIAEHGIPVPWPDAPKDVFVAEGHWGQYVFVIPSYNMVIARTGDDRDDSFKINDFLKLTIAAFSNK